MGGNFGFFGEDSADFGVLGGDLGLEEEFWGLFGVILVVLWLLCGFGCILVGFGVFWALSLMVLGSFWGVWGCFGDFGAILVVWGLF